MPHTSQNSVFQSTNDVQRARSAPLHIIERTFYVNILIDTLTMTWKYDHIYDLIECLHLTDVPWQPLRLRHYDGGQYFDGIIIGWNYDSYGAVTDTYLDLSGKGCRTLEQICTGLDWKEWLMSYYDDIYSKDAHISRIDIACDDVEDEILDIDTIREYSMNDMYVCKSKVLPDVRYRRTEEVYFGSPKSDRLLRIYNKALEQGIPDMHWIRCEFQLRNDNAISFYLNWKNRNIGEVYSGMLIDYLRFIDPEDKDISVIEKNRHFHRFETVYWWEKFTQSAAPISQLYLPGETYTLGHLERYLERQTYSSLKTYLIAHGGDTKDLLEGVKHKELNVKQKQLLAQLPNIEKKDYEY